MTRRMFGVAAIVVLLTAVSTGCGDTTQVRGASTSPDLTVLLAAEGAEHASGVEGTAVVDPSAKVVTLVVFDAVPTVLSKLRSLHLEGYRVAVRDRCRLSRRLSGGGCAGD